MKIFVDFENSNL